MIIEKITIKNFKKFHGVHIFEFNEEMNVIVGDNECGKSTILEAIELVLNGTYRGKPLSSEISTDLFNRQCVEDYLASQKRELDLPEVVIEAHTKGDSRLYGSVNIQKSASEGVSIKIIFNDEHSDSYSIFTSRPVATLPVELYKYERHDFAWKPITSFNKPIKCVFIDPTRLHPTHGRATYINGVINTAITKGERSSLNLNFRQLKGEFDKNPEIIKINSGLDNKNLVTEKSLKITADVSSSKSWESGLQLSVDEINFDQIGRGEQSQIQLKLAMQNKAKDVDVLLIEEPENHLSHMNLTRLMSFLEENKDGKQVFVTTHSSFVLNKLSANNLCLLSNKYVRLLNLDSKTTKILQRLPGYDTLRVVLAEKVLLVEGPSDELVLKKIYLNMFDRLPEEDGIDIIVVRGIGFKMYLNIARELGKHVRVIKDNDGNYEKNITDWKSGISNGELFEVYSSNVDELNSLEPSLIEANSGSLETLDCLAEVILSRQTYNKYAGESGLQNKKQYLIDWFSSKSAGKRKVDSAIRIFDSSTKIGFPSYLKEALDFEK